MPQSIKDIEQKLQPEVNTTWFSERIKHNQDLHCGQHKGAEMSNGKWNEELIEGAFADGLGSGTPSQAWLNYHDGRSMNHKQTEM